MISTTAAADWPGRYPALQHKNNPGQRPRASLQLVFLLALEQLLMGWSRLAEQSYSSSTSGISYQVVNGPRRTRSIQAFSRPFLKVVHDASVRPPDSTGSGRSVRR